MRSLGQFQLPHPKPIPGSFKHCFFRQFQDASVDLRLHIDPIMVIYFQVLMARKLHHCHNIRLVLTRFSKSSMPRN